MLTKSLRDEVLIHYFYNVSVFGDEDPMGNFHPVDPLICPPQGECMREPTSLESPTLVNAVA